MPEIRDHHYLWPTFDQPKKKLWIVFYKGLTGMWIASSPYYFLETAERMASKFDRPTRILEYELSDELEVDTSELKTKYPEPKKQKPQVQTIRVRMQKGG